MSRNPESIAREFAGTAPCCIGKCVGLPLQPPFIATVATSADGAVDFAELADELDVIHNYSHTECATTVIEKLHKVNGDLVSSGKKSKVRDARFVQRAFQLGRLKTIWEHECGATLTHDRDNEAAKQLFEASRAHAYHKNPNRLGNDKIAYLNLKRRLHKEAGGSFANRDLLEKTWEDEWGKKSDVEKIAFRIRREEEHNLDALEQLCNDGPPLANCEAT